MLKAAKRAVQQARSLRRSLTLPEGLLWRELRKRPKGLKFRRQHPCGRFIIDFYCDAARLGIEVDGLAHDLGNRPQHDLARDSWLEDHGIRMLRIPAVDVLRDLDAVMRQIEDRCRPLHHPASPSGPPPLQGGMP